MWRMWRLISSGLLADGRLWAGIHANAVLCDGEQAWRAAHRAEGRIRAVGSRAGRQAPIRRTSSSAFLISGNAPVSSSFPADAIAPGDPSGQGTPGRTAEPPVHAGG